VCGLPVGTCAESPWIRTSRLSIKNSLSVLKALQPFQVGTCAKIGKESLYLVDSGAQYRDGTTDVRLPFRVWGWFLIGVYPLSSGVLLLFGVYFMGVMFVWVRGWGFMHWAVGG